MRAHDPIPFTILLDTLMGPAGVGVRSVELSGRLMAHDVDDVARRVRGVDLDVLAETDDDARALATAWGLGEHAPGCRPAVPDGGEYVHRRWTGTLPTTRGPVTTRIRTCRYLPPPPADVTAGPSSASWSAPTGAAA